MDTTRPLVRSPLADRMDFQNQVLSLLLVLASAAVSGVIVAAGLSGQEQREQCEAIWVAQHKAEQQAQAL